jgi:predicted transcriptional regulator
MKKLTSSQLVSLPNEDIVDMQRLLQSYEQLMNELASQKGELLEHIHAKQLANVRSTEDA